MAEGCVRNLLGSARSEARCTILSPELGSRVKSSTRNVTSTTSVAVNNVVGLLVGINNSRERRACTKFYET